MISQAESMQFMRDLPPDSYDGIFTDPPYNVSEDRITGGQESIDNLQDRRPIRSDLGEWDKDYDPEEFITLAEKVLRPGAWLVSFTGDMTFPDHYLGIRANENLFYKASISWIKPNPVPKIRPFNFRSSVEWIIVAIKGADGKKIKPNVFNWLGQRNMLNWVSGPAPSTGERLYWHKDGDTIVPCLNPRRCSLCAKRGMNDRIGHPAQKPIWLWEWLYKRLTIPGMQVYDPYAGVGSGLQAAISCGLEWTGTERKADYVTVGNLWATGRWGVPSSQISLF